MTTTPGLDNTTLPIVECDSGTMLGEDGKTTDRGNRSRRSYSGSNTKHLFKKRDKSGSDGDSSSMLVTPRTNFPIMTSEDVIL